MGEKRINWMMVVILTAATVSVAASPEAASPPAPTAYSEIGFVRTILPDGDAIWSGTQGGDLVRVDSSTGAVNRIAYPVPGVPIVDLARDSRGHIWAATGGGGLGLFDGEAWTTFTPQGSSFPSFDVRAVLVDGTERVWAGTDAGVAFLDGNSWSVFNRDNSGLVSDDVTALAVGNRVWAGTASGLSALAAGHRSLGQWVTFQSTNYGLPQDHVYALTLDSSGMLWVGTETGAAWTRDGTEWWTNAALDRAAHDIWLDGSGSPWFNMGQHVGHLTECSWATYDSSTIGLKASSIAAIALDDRGRLWAGAEGGLAMLEAPGASGRWASSAITQPVRAMDFRGDDMWLAPGSAAMRYNTSTGEQALFLPEHGLGGEVRAITTDEGGQVWFATWGHGITVFDGNGWEVHTTENSPLPSDYVSSAASVPGGGMVFGTSAGLVSLQAGNWHTYAPSELGLQSEGITAVAAGTSGKLAVGTNGEGVSLYDGQRWVPYRTANSGLASDYIQVLLFDRMGLLWAGTQGSGVARWNGVAWTSFRSGPGGPRGSFVYALAEGTDGRVWMGTEDGGLSGFDGCIWTSYDGPEATDSPSSVYALATDGAGRVWAGTGQGLFAFTPPHSYPHQDPPPSERVMRETVEPASQAQRAVAQITPDTDRWITHGTGKSVHHITFADDVLWASTLYGGAVQWNALGEFTRYLYPQDGIGGNQVVFSAVDPLGRVWCATLERGVSVFDGVKWTVYDSSNSGLIHNDVNGIAFGKAGEVWFATLGGGVSMFDGQNWQVFNKDNSGIAGDFVWYVAVDSQGRLWCGCMQGLSVYDGQTWYTYPDTRNVHCIAFDGQGRTWFGDGMGLSRVDGTDIVQVGREQRGVYVYTRDVYAIAFDEADNAWLGTASGIYRFDGDEMVNYATETTGLRGRQVFAAAVGPDGRVWFGTDSDDGIASFDGSTWEHYSTVSGPNPVSTDVIASYVDARGRIWLGTDRGVSVYDGWAWTGYTPDNSGLATGRVQAIAQDASGRLWFGTPEGISILDGDYWTTVVPEMAGVSDPHVNALLFDSAGRAWAGGDRGVSVFDGRAWQMFTPDNSPLAGHGITSLAEDARGRIWIGSYWTGEISVVDGTRWETVQPAVYGQDAVSVYAIAASPQGDMWVGTMSGFSVFDGSQWTAYSRDTLGMATRSVSSIAFDSSGRTWIAGYGGVDRLEGSEWIHYTSENSPLVGVSIGTIAVDTGGHIWFGATEGGASELIPAANRFPMPAAPTPTPTWTPYVQVATATATATPVPEPTPTETPLPTAVSQAAVMEPSGFFADFWKRSGGGDGPLGWAMAPEHQMFCAEQRFENGYMFWRNQDPEQSVIYSLTYDDGSQESGRWQAFADTWAQGEPESAGYTPPADREEPVRGFGKTWRGMAGETPPPPIGWAIEGEYGLAGARYQDFENATLLHTPRLSRIMVLMLDGQWRSYPVP